MRAGAGAPAASVATGHRLGDGQQSHVLLTIPRASLALLFRRETCLTPVYCAPAGSQLSPQDASGSGSGLGTHPSAEPRVTKSQALSFGRGREGCRSWGKADVLRVPCRCALQGLYNNLHYFSNEKPSLLPILTHSTFHGSDFFLADDEFDQHTGGLEMQGGRWETI